MKDLSAVEDKDTLKYVVRHELKTLGIKIPKEKRGSVRCTQGQKEKSCGTSMVLGSSLDDMLTVHVNEGQGFEVPKFLVDCVEFLQGHLDSEGLFRKPGSRTRQRELLSVLENNTPIPPDAHIHDVAGLFKLFFRDLPESFIPSKLTDALIKCQQLGDCHDVRYTTILLCLALPPLHLHTLRYAMQFLHQVATRADYNKMDVSNLALVMTPNLMGGLKMDKSGTTAATERLLKQQMVVVRRLIENAHDIGLVPDSVMERVESFGNRSGDLLTDRLTSEDELDKSWEAILEERKKNRRRRRSGPIQGIMSGIGQSLGILKSGSSSAIIKTPATDEVFENPSFLGETPKILRSSKRKASDELCSFSSVKRKAMLQQMTVDPQYSKPGLSLHREIRQGLTVTDSPITPIRPNGPALGEVDAVTQDGATVFKFQTPSIKFADESFTTFCATPPGRGNIGGATPGKKHGKANLLGSKKYKRRSGVIQNDMVTPKTAYTTQTPRSGSVYESIKKKLGHKHTRTQPTPIHLNDMPDKSVGWRLANPPVQDDSSAVDRITQGNSPRLRKTPVMKRKNRRQKMPSSPATLFMSHSTVSEPAQSPKNSGQSSVARVKGDSPKVVVVDLKSVGKSPDPHTLEREGFGVKSNQKSKPGYSKNEIEEVKNVLTQSPGSATKKLVAREPCMNEVCLEDMSKYQPLERSLSQKSLSSVLSEISIESSKSVFSVEIDYDMTMTRESSGEGNDTSVGQSVVGEIDKQSHLGTPRMHAYEAAYRDVALSAPLMSDHYTSGDYSDTTDEVQSSMEFSGPVASSTWNLENTLNPDTTLNADDGYIERVQSLESVNEIGECETDDGRRLVKSLSVDSGKGLSLDNLVSIEDGKLQQAIEKCIASEKDKKSAQSIPQGLVKMMSNRLSSMEDTSEDSSCSISSEENPQFRETKAFWKLARTGQIFTKSLSDSQVNSPNKERQALSPSARSYHSQIHLEKRERERLIKGLVETPLNTSVKSNINKFNSMSWKKTAPNRKPLSELHYKEDTTSNNETTTRVSNRASPKTNFLKSVSIDSGMFKMHTEFTASDCPDDFPEMAFDQGPAVQIPHDLQNTIGALCTPKLVRRKTTPRRENAEEKSNPEMHQMSNQSASPHGVLDESSQTSNKKTAKIKRRSPLRQIQVSSDDITPPSTVESKPHKRYPCSPKNPLLRPKIALRRSVIPSHVLDDMDIVEL